MTAALRIDGLCVDAGELRLLDGVGLTLTAGRVHGLVGESGSGKSLTALAALRLLPEGLRVTGGSITADGADVQSLGADSLAAYRGRGVALVPQEALSSLDPVSRVGAQVLEVLQVHHRLVGSPAKARALELLAQAGLDAPTVFQAFPHQLSGGMRQRALLVCALACDPKVLIADEPTTAVDAALRGQVLGLLSQAARERGVAVCIITHDLHVVREACDEVTVLYAGRVAERGPAPAVLASPRHPYTAGLLAARPSHATRGQPLPAIPGQVPAPSDRVHGCAFRPRCAHATAVCEGQPVLQAETKGRAAACHHPLEPGP